jgi:hypothetical protein
LKNKKPYCITIVWLWVSLSCAFAQNKKSNEAGGTKSSAEMIAIRTIYFPEFYNHGITRHDDTAFSYECYDEADRLINVDTLHNTGIIHEIFFVKSFTDRRYAPGGNISAPYLTKKILAFVKVDKDSWIEKNMADKSTLELEGYEDKITRADTTISLNKSTGLNQVTIRKYYLVKQAQSPHGSVYEH